MLTDYKRAQLSLIVAYLLSKVPSFKFEDQTKIKKKVCQCFDIFHIQQVAAKMTSATRQHLTPKVSIALYLCIVLVIGTLLLSNDANFVQASGKKKFLKGFILGTLLAKNHYPVVYSMPSHHGGGGHSSYGGGGW